MIENNYYAILGVKANASQSEIKKAYKRLAKKYHPDVSKEKNAESKFKSANEAYGVLKNKTRRTRYDLFGLTLSQQRQTEHQQKNTSHKPANKKPVDSEPQQLTKHKLTLNISLFEAFKGVQRKVSLNTNKTITIDVPVSIKDGEKIHLTDLQQKITLEVTIKVKPHKRFRRIDKDIDTNITISTDEATKGTTITVPTLRGLIKLTIPKGMQSGEKLCLKGRGFTGSPSGDQFVIVHIAPLSNKAKKIKITEQLTKELTDIRNTLLIKKSENNHFYNLVINLRKETEELLVNIKPTNNTS